MFSGSNSSSVDIHVSPEQSVLSPVVYFIGPQGDVFPISVNHNTVEYGLPLGIEIDVKGKSGVGDPTGTASITIDDVTDVGRIPLAQGASGFSGFPQLNPLPGKHRLTISYSGDNSFLPAVQQIPFSVDKGIALSNISVVPAVVTEGTPVEIYVGLAPVSNTAMNPTGTVDLWDNGQHLAGPLQLVQYGIFGATAQVAYEAHLSAAGFHTISLTYSGDSNFGAGLSFSHPFTVTVNPATGALARVTFEQKPSAVTVGQAVNYVMTVRPVKANGPLPTGTVTLISLDGFTQSPPVPLINGNATFTQPYYATGDFLNAVSYSGDSNYSAADSPSLFTLVKQLVPTVHLTTASAVVSDSIPTSITVQVVGQPKNPNLEVPLGAVRFFDSVNGGREHGLGGPQYLTIGNGGNAIYTMPVLLAKGMHIIRAQYLGTQSLPYTDPNDWAPASSNEVTVMAK